MDALIASAARALASGDPLGALKRLALRNDPSRSRFAAFRPGEGIAESAACAALSGLKNLCLGPGVLSRKPRLRSLLVTWAGLRRGSTKRERRSKPDGDWSNVAHARLLELRRLLLIGGVEGAERRCRGRSRRWIAPPMPAFTTILLLPASVLDVTKISSPDKEEGVMMHSAAQITRECGPLVGIDAVHGVSHDAQHGWFASGDKLHSLDPKSGETQRSSDARAHAGTTIRCICNA